MEIIGDKNEEAARKSVLGNCCLTRTTKTEDVARGTPPSVSSSRLAP